MSLATTYRPRVLEDVIGQEVPVKVIRNILRRFQEKNCDSSFLPNGIILEGEWGSGKTTLARILARYLNCEKGPVEACGQCKSCQDIEFERSRNLIECDAASNRGVAEIAQLKDRTSYKVQGRVLVIVLDEVHMLSKEAWGSMLKTLEDSQRNVLWVMCTTDSQKILDTIRSRSVCLHINTVIPAVAAARIEEVAKMEGLSIDNHTAQMVSFISKGHMRDCLQLLETASDLTEDKTITLEHVYSAANLTGAALVKDFIQHFYNGNDDGMNTFIQQYVDSPVKLIRSAMLSVHSDIVTVQPNDPVPLSDKILMIRLLSEALKEFRNEGFLFPFVKHYFLRFLNERVKVAA